MFRLVYLQLLLSLVPALAEIEMDFTKFPESVTAPVGDNVTFECEVRVPGDRLSWRWKRAERSSDEWKAINGTTDKDQISSRLIVQVEEDVLPRLYQCVVSYGSISLASIPARLVIARLKIVQTSRKRVVISPVSSTVMLHCQEPFSEPPAAISWWREIETGVRTSLEAPHGVLVIQNVSVDDTGTYGCTATNEFSNQELDFPEKTYLRVQHENIENPRFLETEDYVGTFNNEGVLTMPVGQNSDLTLWCGIIGTPAPRVIWSKEGEKLPRRHVTSYNGQVLTVSGFTPADEGIYSCSYKHLHRSWKVIALRPPVWKGKADSVNVTEGESAHVSCGSPTAEPSPDVYWLLNSQSLKKEKGIRTTNSDLYIERAEKRHAGIVQCFACNEFGCAYDAAMLTVVPMQISDQEYSAELEKSMILSPSTQKRHNKKNRKSKVSVQMVPPTQPNVTRMSDTSVMVTWSSSNQGMHILWFKVQYREATNSSNGEWHTTKPIPPHTKSYQVDGLRPGRYYKFRVAAIYQNQDNKLGKASSRFYLQSGGQFQVPNAPVLTNAISLSPYSLQVNWTWSPNGGVNAEGFYVYWRAMSSADIYEKVTAPHGAAARSATLKHLTPDTAYELKVQAYTSQAPSDFSANYLVAKTLRVPNATESTTESRLSESRGGEGGSQDQASGALVTAGGVLGATALILTVAVTLLLCRRAGRSPDNKEKVSAPEGGGGNGYISAKVPITITSDPIHAESADVGVEMSLLHNNNCGNTTSNDDTLPHPRKTPASARRYV